MGVMSVKAAVMVACEMPWLAASVRNSTSQASQVARFMSVVAFSAGLVSGRTGVVEVMAMATAKPKATSSLARAKVGTRRLMRRAKDMLVAGVVVVVGVMVGAWVLVGDMVILLVLWGLV